MRRTRLVPWHSHPFSRLVGACLKSRERADKRRKRVHLSVRSLLGWPWVNFECWCASMTLRVSRKVFQGLFSWADTCRPSNFILLTYKFCIYRTCGLVSTCCLSWANTLLFQTLQWVFTPFLPVHVLYSSWFVTLLVTSFAASCFNDAW